MTNIKKAWWFILALTSLAWYSAEPGVFGTAGFIPIRALFVQYSGLLTMMFMSVAMFLAIRPLWPEQVLGGLDKSYRLHKWLGVSIAVTSVGHWMGANAPKWAAAWGLFERGPRGPHPVLANPIAQALASWRGVAESIGEWTFYAAALLVVVALVKWIPYRLFYKTHRLMAIAYLALVFHAVVLLKFDYWQSPVAILVAPLMAVGVWAAILILLGRAAADRQHQGEIVAMQYYPGVRTLEVAIDVVGWTGHKPGQFAFVTSNASEGAHPYTIASAWNANDKRITFVVKELGDHTGHLNERLSIGQSVKVEGPYGCFTFDDARPQQIWVGGGIGITPFIARMKYLAAQRPRSTQTIDFFHTTADVDEVALAKLNADAAAAGVRLHVLIDKRDGRLDGERIREAVSSWRDSSIWVCGPFGLSEGLKRSFASAGMVLDQQFHREFFAMR